MNDHTKKLAEMMSKQGASSYIRPYSPGEIDEEIKKMRDAGMFQQAGWQLKTYADKNLPNASADQRRTFLKTQMDNLRVSIVENLKLGTQDSYNNMNRIRKALDISQDANRIFESRLPITSSIGKQARNKAVGIARALRVRDFETAGRLSDEFKKFLGPFAPTDRSMNAFMDKTLERGFQAMGSQTTPGMIEQARNFVNDTVLDGTNGEGARLQLTKMDEMRRTSGMGNVGTHKDILAFIPPTVTPESRAELEKQIATNVQKSIGTADGSFINSEEDRALLADSQLPQEVAAPEKKEDTPEISQSKKLAEAYYGKGGKYHVRKGRDGRLRKYEMIFNNETGKVDAWKINPYTGEKKGAPSTSFDPSHKAVAMRDAFEEKKYRRRQGSYNRQINAARANRASRQSDWGKMVKHGDIEGMTPERQAYYKKNYLNNGIFAPEDADLKMQRGPQWDRYRKHYYANMPTDQQNALKDYYIRTGQHYDIQSGQAAQHAINPKDNYMVDVQKMEGYRNPSQVVEQNEIAQRDKYDKKWYGKPAQGTPAKTLIAGTATETPATPVTAPLSKKKPGMTGITGSGVLSDVTNSTVQVPKPTPGQKKVWLDPDY